MYKMKNDSVRVWSTMYSIDSTFLDLPNNYIILKTILKCQQTFVFFPSLWLRILKFDILKVCLLDPIC